MRKAVTCLLIGVFALLLPAVVLAQGYEPPNSVELPGWIMTIIQFFSNKWVVSVAFSGIVIGVVQVAKVLIATFGSHLGEKGVYFAALVVALLTALATAASDGVISGPDWIDVFPPLITLVGALLGYRVLFSAAARAKINK